MAIKPLNSVAGYSIGEYPSTVIIDANGNVTTGNLTSTANVDFTGAGNVSLGAVGNVKITGGSSGYYLQTNGSGGLAWAAVPSGNGIANGTSNVSIPVASGNIVMYVNGGAVANITASGVNVFGTLSATGNANVGNIAAAQVLATANITAPQLISNITTGTAPLVVSSTTLVSNLNADLLDGYNTATANTASTVAVRDASGNISANFFIGNGSQLTGLNTDRISNGTSNVSIPTVNGNVNLVAVGNTTMVITGTGANITGTLNVTGNANVGNIGATRGVFTNVAGEGGNLSNIQGGNVSGQVSNALIAGTVYTNAQPNITSVGTLTSLAVTGNTTSGNFIGALANGNSNVNIPSANGNVNITAVGNTTLVVTGTGANITGTLNASGNANVGNLGATAGVFTTNVTAGNVYANSGIIGAQTLKGEGGNISNIQGANVSGTVSSATTAGTVTTAAQPNITSVGTLTSLTVTGTASAGNLSTGGTLSVTGNANVGNLGTSGLITATGNVSGGNLTTSGIVNATGNIVSGANVVTDFIVGKTTSVTITATGTDQNINLVPTGTGTVNVGNFIISNVQTPVADYDAATKKYVDDVAQGLNIHDSCQAATPNTLAIVTGGTITYNNGASGVGANLVTTGSFNLIDGVNVQTAGTRILVKNEANAVFNGIYTWANASTIVRATDYDTVPEVEAGDFVFVTAGTVYDNTGWVQTSTVAAIGTAGNTIDFTQFSGAGTYTAGTGLQLDGSVFSIANTTVTPGAYGNGDRVATFTVNQQGQLTAAANVAITANAANLTGSTLASGITTSSLTTVGTLGSLTVTGNTASGNFNTTGQVVSTLATGTAPLVVSSTTRVANLNVSYANVADFINVTAPGTGTGYLIFANATTGNITEYTSAGISSNLANNSITATTFVGALSGAATSATTAGTVTTNAQPNITSVGTLTSLTVTGNATVGNLVGPHANGNSNVNIPAANGNVNITAVGNTTMIITGTGANITGTLNASGNANVGNIGGGAAVFTTANLTTINSGLVQNGTSNVTIASGGNVSTFIGGNATAQMIVTSTGANIAGYANVVGNISAGNITATNGNLTTANVSGNVVLGNSSITTKISWASATTTAITANQNIASFSVTGVTGVEFLVKGVDATGSKYSVATVVAVTNGTSADYSTFGTVNLGGYTGTLAVNVTGSVLYLQVTPASSNSTVWTTQYRFI